MSIPVLLALLAGCTSASRPAAAPTPSAAAAVEAPPSTKPGINDNFLDPEMAVDDWVARFETESREVVSLQPAIVAALELAPGEVVADIGAGTGLYLAPFVEAVGAEGEVYAVDISPRFLDHLRGRAAAEGWSRVHVVEGTATSAELPASAVDVVFICDTYHHFEYPDATLTSLHDAMEPGGRLYVLDFERVEGESSEWVLGHVRAGKEVFTQEITAAGFRADGELEVGLKDNYLLRFRKE